MQTQGYCVDSAEDKLHSWAFQRRAVGDEDVLIEIMYCGVCHTDIHQARNNWGNAVYPMVPGHEIVGIAAKIGSNVKNVKVGDHVGVGTIIESCKDCKSCRDDEEQLCERGCAQTYNSTLMDRKTPTYGGYSRDIVVDSRYVFPISDKFKDLKGIAPLFCAGITTFSPLNQWKARVENGKRVGVVGLGGLGHLGVKIAVAMGADVTVFSTSPSKEQDAKKLGAQHLVVSKDKDAMKKVEGTFDLILNTVPVDHDIRPYLGSLKSHGVLAIVGVPPGLLTFHGFDIVAGNKIISGSLVGGMKETQEMLEFCAEKGIVSDVEVITIDQIETAFERTLNSDVRYRFVIDVSSIKK